MTEFKWVWIKKNILERDDLSLNEKFLFSLIESLQKENWCYANNLFFANKIMLSKRTISRLLKSLEDKYYVKSINVNWNRYLKTKNMDMTKCPEEWKFGIRRVTNLVKIDDNEGKNITKNVLHINNINKINNKKEEKFSYFCEFWNRHNLNDLCDCDKVLKVSHFKFRNFLKENWFRILYNSDITDEMKVFFKNNYNKNR